MFYSSNQSIAQSANAFMNVFYSTIKVPILIWLKKLIILTNEQCKKKMILETRNFLARTFYSFVAYIVAYNFFFGSVLCCSPPH